MKILITGATGLVGSQAVSFFKEKKWEVVGIDANMRAAFFETPDKVPEEPVDIRDETAVNLLFQTKGPFDAIIHTAAQPSHDYSKDHVLEDFDINARGTVILLEAARKYSPKAVFVHCSTDKIYGEGMKRRDLLEDDTKYVSPLEGEFTEGTPFKAPFSPFGVSKLYSDFIVQEYAAQGWLTTGTFRMGCITGARHEGAEQHGFLAYLAKCVITGKPYTIYGYKGKQVRDQIHAYDLVNAFYHFIQNPRSGAYYNIGGGPERAISPLEAIAWFEKKYNKKAEVKITEEPRFGDRQWDVHDVSKFKTDYPEWDYQWSLEHILQDLCNKKS